MTERELFKEAVMDYMVNDTRVLRASKQRKERHAMRRVLATAACLILVAAVTVFSIPSARAEVTEWLRSWFTPRGYFEQEKENRTDEPTIEAIITGAETTNIAITNIGDGFEDYAANFSLKLEEIAYDGENIFITGIMPGAVARPFVQAYTGGDTFRCAKNDGSLGGDPNQEYYYFACENSVRFETADGRKFRGEISPSFTAEMDAIATASAEAGNDGEAGILFENGVLISTGPATDKLWDAYLADHDVRFAIEMWPIDLREQQPLSGKAEGLLTLSMYYENVDSKPRDVVLEANLGRITVDAESYKALTTQAAVGTSVQLGGVHPVTIQEWQPEDERPASTDGVLVDSEVYLYTHELDFTGASVTVNEIAFTPTDTQLMMHVVLPASWTKYERGDALTFHFLLDGKAPSSPHLFSAGGPHGRDYEGDWLEYDYRYINSAIPPSEWAAAKTLTIIPTTRYWWEMYVDYDNGPEELFSLRDGAVHTGISNHTGYRFDELYDEMTEYAITIHLDDYR